MGRRNLVPGESVQGGISVARLRGSSRRNALFGILLAMTVFASTTSGAAQTVVEAEPLSSSVDEYEPLLEADGSDLDALLELADQDLAQLSRVDVTAPALAMEVSTVSRQVTTVGRSPAAVFVITNEMIRRSGARCIPEVLRMAPGVEVARVDANKWAISIRGFNGRFANKLLVQIDGRSVYTPLFGGVFWDVQDVVLEDVERIEVIRGPGATVWGSNAVNGIINVITKRAKDTRGVYVRGGSGTEEKGFVTARYGGQIGTDLNYRVYAKWFERDRAQAPFDGAHDDWRMGRTGLRADWTPTDCDTVTVQGDLYLGQVGQRGTYPSLVPPTYTRVLDHDTDVSGANVLLRWTRELSPDAGWAAQVYYDRTGRQNFLNNDFGEDRDTIDFDFQHNFQLTECHTAIWGVGYRNTRDDITNSFFAYQFLPAQREINLFSYFVQDQMTLAEDLCYLTVGCKFEHNDFTGFEYQPTARLLWTPNEQTSVWGSISRAIRLPTRLDDDANALLPPLAIVPNPLPPPPVTIPIFPQVLGNRGFDSETLIAYECGMRSQPTEQFSWDLALFANQYDNLYSLDFQMPVAPTFPLLASAGAANDNRAQSYGAELAVNYSILPWWRLYSAYTYFAAYGGALGSDGGDPANQLYLQSGWDLGDRWELDVIWRYVDVVEAQRAFWTDVVPSYNVMDVRLAWYPTDGLETAVVGRHLLAGSHVEFPTDEFMGSTTTAVQNEVYWTVAYRR
jgi:iron complex outermembrane receptor protein